MAPLQVACVDSRYRVVNLWVVFCESEGEAPCLLLHAPVWLLSYVHWPLQYQNHKQDEQTDTKDGKKLAAVEFRVTQRSGPTEEGWAMQAVSAAAAAVDLSGDSLQRRAPLLARIDASAAFDAPGDSEGDIRLLDFNVRQACAPFLWLLVLCMAIMLIV